MLISFVSLAEIKALVLKLRNPMSTDEEKIETVISLRNLLGSGDSKVALDPERINFKQPVEGSSGDFLIF